MADQVAKGRRGARMTDVAAAAGVALVTVSRALNQPGKVSPATLARVQAEVKRLGYVPDLTAGSLASARSHIVGAIVPTLSNTWFADTMEGLAAALAPAGYQLMLSQSNYHPQSEAGLVDAFLGRRVDALVLTGASHDRKVRVKLRRLGLPVLETWDLPELPLDMAVGFSNAGVGLAVGRYLWDKGYRRIAFLGASEERSLKRLAGLQAALLPHGLRPADTELMAPPSTIAEGAQALQRLMARTPAIDALFCSNDLLAVGALQYAREKRWAVPGRLAVVGFSDLAVAEAVSPALTTVRVRAPELGRRAGELLLSRLAGDTLPRSDRVIDLGFELVERASA
ncbi:MAG TPA: LacI family DNA-binding transcriptional regulator [Ramlibacter sp.]|nr:LacI family DNA-binding transcriptional regulator [Ramlibacter sp.]